VAALGGFGALADRHADGLVDQALDDADPLVRLAAAQAMLTVGQPQEANHLATFLDPKVENDPTIRDAAWAALAKLLETGNLNFVRQWVGQFGEDKDKRDEHNAERRLAVELDYARVLAAAGQDDEAAANNQAIGSTYMKLNRPADAVAPLLAALDYNQRTQGPQARLTDLIAQVLDARLSAKQYPAAIEFAAQQLKADNGNQPVVGKHIEDAADALKASDPEDAGTLIEAALAMQPPLEDRFVRYLKEIRDELHPRHDPPDQSPAAPPRAVR
jgi:tetratricopeptide (TPR) repeat protein